MVEQIDIKQARIKLNISGVSIWVRLDEVHLIESREKKGSDPKVMVRLDRDKMSFSSLDIRGKRVEEAEVELLQFLDRAIYRGASSVEIIHGRGEGILRGRVHEILRELPNVDSFYFAPEDRGGDGVTIVKLR